MVLFSLFRALRDGLHSIGGEVLTHSYLFCPLPAASYHVTVWDGLNDANVTYVNPVHREEAARFLRELPESLFASDLLDEVAASALITQTDWGIRLRFEQLEKWSNVSLVARLAPADEDSADSLKSLSNARAQLSATFHRRYHVSPNESYVPHVSLGYFANEQQAKRKRPAHPPVRPPRSGATFGFSTGGREESR